MPSDQVHISSLVVHVRPEFCAEASARIGALAGVEIHGASDTGKLVVVLETAHEADILKQINLINEMPGIITTSMIYHEIDTAEEA
jgi:nitrate reductase NapD